MTRRLVSFLFGASLVAAVGIGVAVALGEGGPMRLLVAALGGAVALVTLLLIVPDRVDGWAVRIGGMATGVGAGVAGVVLFDGRGVFLWAVAATALVVAVAGSSVAEALQRPLPGWAMGAGLVLLAGLLVMIVLGGGGLGHDESAYALKARAWLFGYDDGGWTIHRAVAPSVLAALVLPVTESAVALRLVSVALTLLTVVAVWWLGRTLHSSRVGAIAAALFAAGPSLIRRGAEYLTDVPATGLLLVVAALMWRWLTGERPRPPTLYLAAVVGAASVYFRYQSALALALLAVVAATLFRSRVRAEVLTVLGAAGVGLALLLPHFVYATAVTGTPWGVFLVTGEIAGREYLGQGFVDYLSQFPYDLAGPLGAIAILLALGWTGWRVWSRRRRSGLEPIDRAALFCLLPALGLFATLGLVSHGEPRFMFWPVALLMVVAGLAVADLARVVARPRADAATNLAAVGLLLLLVLAAVRADRNAEARGLSTEILERTAAVVVEESGDGCGILTSYSPQLNWYSGCRVIELRTDRVVDLPAGVDWHLVLFANGKRQPQGEILERYLAMAEGGPTTVDDEVDGIGDATIWRLSPDRG